ncbi:hypothetical protein BJ944DRAFT_273509, partial [Cunninghamella echinulata]
MACRQQALCLSSLPLEILLKIANYVHFSDLWYLSTASQSCRKLAHHIIWHKYGIDLYKPRLNAFSHLVHSAVAYVCRYGIVHEEGTTNHLVLQSVANRLAVEIYDRSPLQNWEPCLDFLVDKTLGILLDHVLFDTCHDKIPEINTSGTISLSTTATNTNTTLHQIQRCPYSPTRMGKLITDFLTTLYPTLTALFDDHAASIHHRLLINHLNRHLDTLTHRYHYHHKRRLECKHMKSWKLINRSVRHSVRVLVRFMGTLVQTDLLSANDLRILTHQRIVALFLVQQYHLHQKQQQQHSKEKELDKDQKGNVSTITSIMASLSERGWQDEIEFQMTILLDLVRAVIDRHFVRSDAGMELNMFTSMLKNTVSDFISYQPSSSSSSSSSTSITTTSSASASSSSASSTSSSLPSHIKLMSTNSTPSNSPSSTVTTA